VEQAWRNQKTFIQLPRPCFQYAHSIGHSVIAAQIMASGVHLMVAILYVQQVYHLLVVVALMQTQYMNTTLVSKKEAPV
jgi:hypothetical protein